MATDVYWQLEKDYYCLSERYDLIIRVIEHQAIHTGGAEGDRARTVTDWTPSKVSEFKVLREVVAKSSASFLSLLKDQQGQQSPLIVVREPGTAYGLSVWLKLIHDIEVKVTSVSLRGIWEMLAAATRHGFNTANAMAWFESWYSANQNAHKDQRFGYGELQLLLLPCYMFNHAIAFAETTRILAYQTCGEIIERRPYGTHDPHLRLNPAIMRMLNAAKTRLKTHLHHSLYDPIDCILKSPCCPCGKHVIYSYQRYLTSTGVWPFETVVNKLSIDDILEGLEKSPGSHQSLPLCGDCLATFNPATLVDVAKVECRTHFDGLCLDCMKTSQGQGPGGDEEYWQHRLPDVHWDRGCRIRHWQPTWFFSYFGEKKDMSQFYRQSSEKGVKRLNNGAS